MHDVFKNKWEILEVPNFLPRDRYQDDVELILWHP
jgi:hypothetical protein